ncbi:MAG TPA: ATP-dependent RecD-like DNA helicase [Bacillota bacterium]|nr:ATP-dependent RecD-like DNA helicase [Bacillota bacterium]
MGKEMQTQEDSYFIGELLFVIFQNEQEHFTIANFKVIDTNEEFPEEEIVAKGHFTNLNMNTSYVFYGEIVHHPQYGMQYDVHAYELYIPDDRTGLINYLSSDLFYGVGKKTAERIVDKLGTKAIQKIIEQPNLLDEIPHLNVKAKTSLVDTLIKNQGFENIVTNLSQYNIGLKMSQKIFEQFKEEAFEFIQNDPYQFVFTIEGFGFQTADRIAFHQGLSPVHENRIGAGCIYVLQQSTKDGHVYIPMKQCIRSVYQLLDTQELTENMIKERLKQLAEEDYVVIEEDHVYLPSLYYAEQGVILHLERMLSQEVETDIPKTDLMKIIGDIEEEEEINYDTDQFEAIQKALHEKMMILTGGPGTGKTTIIKGILKAYAKFHELPYYYEQYKDKQDYPFILAAPTGRAAKRLEQSTGLPATTIHRLLGWNGEDLFEKNEYEQLEGQFLIIDEFSMVDIWLANHLLKAIPNDMQILFVGDHDQLPSVGPGQVLTDMIQSERIPVVRLENVFRQQKGSKIIELAHDIKNDQFTKDVLVNDADFSFIPCLQHQVIDVIEQIFHHAKKKGINLLDIQVLAPMYRSEAGINKINENLQQIVNPRQHGKREKKIFDVTYRINDKVIQLVNQPEDGVSNGDIGEIVAIFEKNETTEKKEQIVIKFDEKEVVYYRSDFKNFMHAYCISIHKAQGSEFPIVVLPIVSRYSHMLRKNLIYTGITRAASTLIICGEKTALERGIQTVDTNNRNSALLHKLSRIAKPLENDAEISPYDFLE